MHRLAGGSPKDSYVCLEFWWLFKVIYFYQVFLYKFELNLRVFKY